MNKKNKQIKKNNSLVVTKKDTSLDFIMEISGINVSSVDTLEIKMKIPNKILGSRYKNVRRK